MVKLSRTPELMELISYQVCGLKRLEQIDEQVLADFKEFAIDGRDAHIHRNLVAIA